MQRNNFENRSLFNIYKTLSSNPEIISSLPPLINALKDVETLLTYTGSDKKDNNDTKNNPEQQFYLLLNKIINALNSFGVMTENSELLVSLSFSKNLYQYGREKELINRAKIILDIAAQNLDSLKTFGIEKSTLNGFALTIHIMETHISKNEERIKERTKYILNKIDSLVENIKEDYPSFYDEYKNNKRPVNAADYKNFNENISAW